MMSESPERLAQTLEETLRDVVFDIKLLGDFFNKPGDGDFHLVAVRVEGGGLVLDCGSGTAIAIEAPTQISAQGGTVRVFDAARVELSRNGVLAVVAVRGDEIVVHVPHEPELRLQRHRHAHRGPARRPARREPVATRPVS